jgi:hypothetical protein
MAVLTPGDQFALAFKDGNCERTALYALKGVTAGDTVDVAAEFRVVKRGGIVSATGTTIGAVTQATGTVLTIPAGPAADGVWLLVVGVSI